MMKQLITIWFFAIISTMSQAAEQATIFTGFQKGTYSVVGNDIRKACSSMSIQTELGGSLSNLNALINEPVVNLGHRFALVQKDVYDAIVKPLKKPPVTIVSPLFPEEILILVNKSKGIRTVEDLNGKRVAGGQVGSGMWFTSKALEELVNIQWLNIERTPEETILLLLTGEIDAMIVVSSHPVRLFEELPTSFSQYVNVLNISDHPKINKVYRDTVTIPANTYIWQQNPIKTITTLTYLIAADDVPSHAIKEIKSCLTKNLPALKKLGHPKWKTVNIQ